MNPLVIRQARASEAILVSEILREAAGWLEARGTPLWRDNELLPEKIEAEVNDGRFWIAEFGGAPAGCVRFQLHDPEFWPEIPAGASAFIHRLAVRRAFAGRGVSTALIDFAVKRTAELRLPHLRLDCEANTAKLCALYERHGFTKVDERDIGPYRVARYRLDVTDIA